MGNITKATTMLVIGISLMGISGCMPLAAISTGIVGTTIAEERTAGDKLNDSIITVKIKDHYTQTEISEMLSRISVHSMEGRVLLTGSVTDKKYAAEAAKIAWKVKGVREVINEVEINSKDIKDRAKDLFIESTIESKLLFEKDLSSINYVVDVNNGVVYLLGIAQNDDELKRALQIARSTKGVKKVVNHVIMKDDPRRELDLGKKTLD
jgi:osmotically-inducible protein OsmY